MLGMAFERYVMVCHATNANRILSKSRRVTIYLIILVLVLVCAGLVAMDTIDNEFFLEYFYFDGIQVLLNVFYFTNEFQKYSCTRVEVSD